MAILWKSGVGAGELIKAAHESGEFSVQELQGAVGGYIEVVYLKSDPIVINGIEYLFAICNEDGKLHDLPVNEAANSYVVGKHLRNGDYLVGDVLFLEAHEIS